MTTKSADKECPDCGHPVRQHGTEGCTATVDDGPCPCANQPPSELDRWAATNATVAGFMRRAFMRRVR